MLAGFVAVLELPPPAIACARVNGVFSLAIGSHQHEQGTRLIPGARPAERWEALALIVTCSLLAC